MTSAYRLEGVSFAYGGHAVLHIDVLEVMAGRITALVGPNGSGKTTLLNLLAFLEIPASGTVRFFDAATGSDMHTRLRRRVGFVHQKPYLFHASVRRNLEYGLRWHGIGADERFLRAERALRDFDLEPLAERHAPRLSGGETQKLALARAAVLDPEVLLLDEPFAHLDRDSKSGLEERLRHLRDEHGKTVIFSTHDDRLAGFLADRACRLSEGRIRPDSGVNLFRGRAAGAYFDTGRLKIHVAGLPPVASTVRIDGDAIVLSLAKVESSMRNNFRGTVQALVEQNGGIQLTVDAGETFRVLVTRDSMREMRLGIGAVVWLGFKSSAVQAY